MQPKPLPLSRRQILAAVPAFAIAAGWPPALGARSTRKFELTAQGSAVRLGSHGDRDTKVWAYNTHVPGPEIRVGQDERVRIAVHNRLDEETTVHWHGVRVPNAMDGVPHLTQKPIAPGDTFVYEFDVPDAGTYWYHPHQRGFEQVGRGLYGPLIVEERDPPRFDRDVTWMLDDWRLLPDGSISGDFGNFMDVSHNGRVGNTVTINGRSVGTFPVTAGERVRLRLINAANARIFALRFGGHEPLVLACDGHPVAPHAPPDGLVVLGPAMRADIVLDMTGNPGERFAVEDVFYRGLEYRLLEIAYGERPLREKTPDGPVTLAPNPLREPDMRNARQHDIAFGGGMMGNMSSAMMRGRMMDMRAMMRGGMAWAVNGIAATGDVMDPLLTFPRGTTQILAMNNDTAWHHPIHLHGHAFRVLSRNGAPTTHREWRDTVLMAPREKVEIAFVADNPGDWMFHCHILEHMAGGMIAVLRVT